MSGVQLVLHYQTNVRVHRVVKAESDVSDAGTEGSRVGQEAAPQPKQEPAAPEAGPGRGLTHSPSLPAAAAASSRPNPFQHQQQQQPYQQKPLASHQRKPNLHRWTPVDPEERAQVWRTAHPQLKPKAHWAARACPALHAHSKLMFALRMGGL